MDRGSTLIFHLGDAIFSTNQSFGPKMKPAQRDMIYDQLVILGEQEYTLWLIMN